MKFDLQMFKGNTTSTTTYTASPEERELLAKQLEYQNAFYPNVIRLNDDAGNLLWDSYGDVQADYDALNNQAQQQIASGQGYISGLANGELPQQYLQNMTDAVQSGVQNTLGNAVNSLGQRGVLNSSVTNQAMNDMSKNVSNAMAENYLGNVQAVSGLGQQQISNAAVPLSTTVAAQEAAQQPALNLWNASLGLQQSGNSVLGNIAGKYGTSTTAQKTSSGGIGGVLGGLVSGAATGFLGGLGSGIGSRI